MFDSAIQVLRTKIHGATVTGSDLHYEGSIAIDRGLCDRAGLFPFERVDIYNVTTGARFSTYVIEGQVGEVSLNGAAARLVQRGDQIIIAAYTWITAERALNYKPKILIVDGQNRLKAN